MDQLTEARLRLLCLEAALAKAKPSGRKRIPGDGDGDGIPNESRGKKGGGAGGAPQMRLYMAHAAAKGGAIGKVDGYKPGAPQIQLTGKSGTTYNLKLKPTKHLNDFFYAAHGGPKFRVHEDGRVWSVTSIPK